jgi:hypothetical protein
MIEEGPEWISHQKTRSHRRLAAKIKSSNVIRSDHLTSSEEELGHMEPVLQYRGPNKQNILLVL